MSSNRNVRRRIGRVFKYGRPFRKDYKTFVSPLNYYQMSTHTAVATTAEGVVDTLQVPTEEPQEDEVLIKVEYSAVIPPEVYMVDKGKLIQQYPVILGSTISGTVMKIGSNIKDLKPTDRVCRPCA